MSAMYESQIYIKKKKQKLYFGNVMEWSETNFPDFSNLLDISYLSEIAEVPVETPKFEDYHRPFHFRLQDKLE